MGELIEFSGHSTRLPADAPRAERKWLAMRAKTLLSHYWQSDTDEREEIMILADWVDVLHDVPQEAIERACRRRLMEHNRSRPQPGEIRALALREIAWPKAGRLIEMVEDEFRLEPNSIDGNRRDPETSFGRFAVVGLLRELHQWGDAEIGRRLRRDPATIRHAARRCEELLETDALFRKRYGQVKERLTA